jgi:hypothetical protein
VIYSFYSLLFSIEKKKRQHLNLFSIGVSGYMNADDRMDVGGRQQEQPLEPFVQKGLRFSFP